MPRLNYQSYAFLGKFAMSELQVYTHETSKCTVGMDSIIRVRRSMRQWLFSHQMLNARLFPCIQKPSDNDKKRFVVSDDNIVVIAKGTKVYQ
jgi:hypothetical protein